MEPERITALGHALVVGGGIGGMATAISLAERGVAVELIDIDPDWRIYGAGITITGPTLRAYRRLGMLEHIKREGAITSKTRLFRFDGTHLHDLDEPVIEEGLPAIGGIMRPVLHRIMQARVRELDIAVRLGLTVDALDTVGADSVFSRVRDLAFPHMGPAQPTGQGCWRIAMKRPLALDMGEFFLGHDNPCGITACSATMIYMWMLTPHQRREQHFTEDELFDRLKALLADFGGHAGWIRDTMTRDDWLNYRPLAAALQPRPWSNGRVVMLGDAVHATMPALGFGCGHGGGKRDRAGRGTGARGQRRCRAGGIRRTALRPVPGCDRDQPRGGAAPARTRRSTRPCGHARRRARQAQRGLLNIGRGVRSRLSAPAAAQP